MTAFTVFSLLTARKILTAVLIGGICYALLREVPGDSLALVVWAAVFLVILGIDPKRLAHTKQVHLRELRQTNRLSAFLHYCSLSDDGARNLQRHRGKRRLPISESSPKNVDVKQRNAKFNAVSWPSVPAEVK